MSRNSKISITMRKNYASQYGLDWLPSRRGSRLEKKFHDAWSEMNRRCCDKKFKQYSNYGGRGIQVCNRWGKFPYFFVDMWNTYLEHIEIFGNNTSLDRINNDKGYSKINCRWATRTEQQYNRKNTVIVKGRTLEWWSKELNIGRGTLYSRLFVYKFPVEKALSKDFFESGRKRNN